MNEILNSVKKGAEDRFLRLGNSYCNRLEKELRSGEKGDKTVAHSYVSGLADAFGFNLDCTFRREFHYKIDKLFDHFG